MALSFSRSLLAGLTNPNFGDIEAGQADRSAKAMSDRRKYAVRNDGQPR